MKRKAVSFVLSMVLLFSYIPAVLAINQTETPSGVPLFEIEGFIDDYMAQYVGHTSPGAAVVLVKDDEIIFSKGYGYANIEKGTKVDPAGTVFEYGSVSKLFVYTTMILLPC